MDHEPQAEARIDRGPGLAQIVRRVRRGAPVEMESLVADLIAKCYYGRIGGEPAPLHPATPERAPIA